MVWIAPQREEREGDAAVGEKRRRERCCGEGGKGRRRRRWRREFAKLQGEGEEEEEEEEAAIKKEPTVEVQGRMGGRACSDDSREIDWKKEKGEGGQKERDLPFFEDRFFLYLSIRKLLWSWLPPSVVVRTEGGNSLVSHTSLRPPSLPWEGGRVSYHRREGKGEAKNEESLESFSFPHNFAQL